MWTIALLVICLASCGTDTTGIWTYPDASPALVTPALTPDARAADLTTTTGTDVLAATEAPAASPDVTLLDGPGLPDATAAPDLAPPPDLVPIPPDLRPAADAYQWIGQYCATTRDCPPIGASCMASNIRGAPKYCTTLSGSQSVCSTCPSGWACSPFGGAAWFCEQPCKANCY